MTKVTAEEVGPTLSIGWKPAVVDADPGAADQMAENISGRNQDHYAVTCFTGIHIY